MSKDNIDNDFAKIFSGQVSNQKDQLEQVTNIVDSNKGQEEPSEVDIEDKSSKKQSKEDSVSIDTTGDKEDSAALKKRLEESRAWGHKKNIAYVHAKRKITDFLSKLQEDGALSEEETKTALSYFDAKEDDIETKGAEKQANPFIDLKQKLDKEFSLFKKYAKIEEAEDKYNSFFYFWPMLDAKEQEQIITYLEEESTDVALDKIMSTGSELYDNLYKGMNKNGGIIPYIKSLTNENLKLNEKIKQLKAELDNTEGVVYSRSTNSKVINSSNSLANKSFADIWRN